MAALVGILFVRRLKAGLAERLCYSVSLPSPFAINPSAAIVIAPMLALRLTDVQHYPMRSAVIRIVATWPCSCSLCEMLSTWREAFFRQHRFAYHKLGKLGPLSLVDMIDPIDYSYIFKLNDLFLSLWDGYRPHMVGVLALTVFAIVKLVKERERLNVAIGGVALIGALMLSVLNGHARGERFTSLYGQHSSRVFTGVPYVLALLLLFGASGAAP